MEKFWENKNWELKDKHLSKLTVMPFKRSFPFIPEKNGLYIVRGPRQIGKSSWLKTVLSYYSKKEFCFYLSCENITDYKELAEILKSLRSTKVILLDEINFVKDWSRAIKHEIDIRNDCIIMLTGSHSYDLKLGVDRMPGRFEGGGEFFLLPMSFEEFLFCRAQANWKKQNILEELGLFFKVGGFPSAVFEAGHDGKRPQNTLKVFYSWLVGDIVKLGKNETYFKELLISLAVSMQNPISLQTLAKKTSIGSHNTVKEYIDILEACFAVKTLYAIDKDTGAYKFRRDKKFYFTDPLIYQLAYELSGLKIPSNYEEQMAEMMAHEELSRRYKKFGYYKAKRGEIDFLAPKNWALEVKWSDIPKNLSEEYKNINIANKIVWTKNNYFKEYP